MIEENGVNITTLPHSSFQTNASGASLFIHCGLDLEILGKKNFSNEQQATFAEFVVTTKHSTFPHTLKRYLATKLVSASKLIQQKTSSSSTQPKHITMNCGKEKIQFRQLLRGETEDDEKQAAELMAIGGLRNAHLSIRKLPLVVEFGRKLGDKLCALIDSNRHWVKPTMDLIGQDERKSAPDEAIEAVRKLIASECGCADMDPIRNESCSTSIKAHLLE